MDIFKELEKYACEPNISVLADYQEPDLYDKIVKEAMNTVVEKFKKDGICISVDTDASNNIKEARYYAYYFS